MDKIKNMSKKQKVIAGLLLGATLVTLTFAGVSVLKPSYDNKDELTAQEDLPKLVLEYGDEVEDEYPIMKNGKEFTIELPEEIDTMVVGESKHEVDLDGEKVEIKIKVEDTQHPLVSGENEFEIEVGTEREELEEVINENISAEDPVDGDLELSINYKELDLEKIGEYTIFVNAKDANGNRAFAPGIERTEEEKELIIEDGEVLINVVAKEKEEEEDSSDESGESTSQEREPSSSGSSESSSSPSASSGSSGSSSSGSSSSSSSSSGSSGSSSSGSSSSSSTSRPPSSSSGASGSGSSNSEDPVITPDYGKDDSNNSSNNSSGGNKVEEEKPQKPQNGSFNVPSNLPSGSKVEGSSDKDAFFRHNVSLESGVNVVSVVANDKKVISYSIDDPNGGLIVYINNDGSMSSSYGEINLSDGGMSKLLNLDSQYRSAFGW